MEAEYHLIDLATGLSHGGFRSLEAARVYAREEAMVAWDIFRGNVHVERHDPRTDRICQPTFLVMENKRAYDFRIVDWQVFTPDEQERLYMQLLTSERLEVSDTVRKLILEE